MPVKTTTDYRAPFILWNKHFQTIYPALIRGVSVPKYQRERISTPDGDFLDLDWLVNGKANLVILSHGLEGNSTRPYMSGMANIFEQNGYDVLAWNYRGCSGEVNTKPYAYHSGATYDLETVTNYASSKGYKRISLIGFSLGGNMTLKYLGETETIKPSQIVNAVVFSVPLDLEDCAKTIHLRSNFLYERRFLKSFHKKVKEKAPLFEEVDESLLKHVGSVYDFDELYTAPLSGYKSAIDYYEKCSSMQFVGDITVPTLVVNAVNDPFLGKNCYGPTAFEESEHVQLELPAKGGHCGFPEFKNSGRYWSELRALQFVKETSNN